MTLGARAKEKWLDGVASVPTVGVQVLLAGVVILVLGNVGAGNWVRCTFFDTAGCLPRVSVQIASCRAVDPDKSAEEEQHYHLVRGRTTASIGQEDRRTYKWLEQRIRVENVGLSGLQKVKVRYRPAEDLVGYAARVGPDRVTLTPPSDRGEWVPLESEHLAVTRSSGLASWLIRSSEGADVQVLVASKSPQRTGWFEALCDGEKQCQMPFVRAAVPPCE